MTPAAKKKPATSTSKPKLKMNVALLRKVKRRILAKPEKYNQNEWCNTAFCIAGHAFLEGGAPAQIKEFRRLGKLRHNLDREVRYKANCDIDNLVPPTARKLLRLTQAQSDLLFAGGFPEEIIGYSGLEDREDLGAVEHAKLGAKRIDLFISSKGKK